MKSILITGANSGFGRLTAETLARKGNVVFAGIRETKGRNEEAAASLAGAARGAGWKLHVLEMDVADDASVRGAVGRAIETAGKLDVVVNNAGFAAFGLAETFTDDQFRAVFEANFLGPQRVVRAAAPHMRERGEGLLLAVSTVMALYTLPYAAPYTTSKRALEGLMESYRYELAPLGIDSVLVEPGAFLTPAFGKVAPPADTARVSAYGPMAEMPQKFLASFAELVQRPDAPGAQKVADAITALIEMPAGTRPFRTIVDHFTGEAAAAIEAPLAGTQAQLLTGLGLGDLLGVKPR